MSRSGVQVPPGVPNFKGTCSNISYWEQMVAGLNPARRNIDIFACSSTEQSLCKAKSVSCYFRNAFIAQKQSRCLLSIGSRLQNSLEVPVLLQVCGVVKRSRLWDARSSVGPRTVDPMRRVRLSCIPPKSAAFGLRWFESITCKNFNGPLVYRLRTSPFHGEEWSSILQWAAIAKCLIRIEAVPRFLRPVKQEHYLHEVPI